MLREALALQIVGDGDLAAAKEQAANLITWISHGAFLVLLAAAVRTILVRKIGWPRIVDLW
jgi:hypothetical protein